MSNALAIAAVTATLRNLLQKISDITGLSDTRVTTQPLDEARLDGKPHQLNLFLYQVLPNAAWRNMDIPQRLHPGETGMPPLPLNLHYMLTAYGKSDNDVSGHHMLGHAMSILHDHSVLNSQDIAAGLPSETNPPPDTNSELQNQIERVRITLQPLSTEEIFRLWSGFHTKYRVSVAYEVSVILIESMQVAKAPLPVLTRGQEDRGISSQANLIPPFPTIENLLFQHPPSAQLKDDLTLKGHDLLPTDPTFTLQVRFMNARWQTPIDRDPRSGTTPTAIEISVTIPDDPDTWPAGLYTVAVVFKDATADKKLVQTSNEVPFSLAPRILNASANVVKDASGAITNVTIQVQCSPAIQVGQRVALLFGDREVSLAPPITTTTDVLTFEVGAVPAGDYFVRLRVDGVDSLLVDRTVSPPRFDQSQKVTVS
jgi:hypothetical protein